MSFTPEVNFCKWTIALQDMCRKIKFLNYNYSRMKTYDEVYICSFFSNMLYTEKTQMWFNKKMGITSLSWIWRFRACKNICPLYFVNMKRLITLNGITHMCNFLKNQNLTIRLRIVWERWFFKGKYSTLYFFKALYF